MLEADSLKDPLLLHFLFVKRQPFVISGFLDSDEFSVFKDYVPQCNVNTSMNPFDEGGDKEEGIELLSQLLESETEDVIEGEKLAVLIHQASHDDLKLLSRQLRAGWMATSVLPPGELVKKFKVPVYDLKTLGWLNFDPSVLDLSWERRTLQTLQGVELRMHLKQVYHEASYFAIKLLNGDGNGELLERVKRMKDSGDLKITMELLTSYFGLNSADLPSVEAPLKELSNSVNVPRLSFTSEYKYLSMNQRFRKYFVKVLDMERIDSTCTRPDEKYDYLRGEGNWKDGIPPRLLKDWLIDILMDECDDMACAKTLSFEFEQYMTTANVATAKVMQLVIKECLERFLEEKSPALDQERRFVYSPLIEQSLQNLTGTVINYGEGKCVPMITWDGLDPMPKDKAYILQWMNNSLVKLKRFFIDAGQLLRIAGKDGRWIIPGKVKAFTNREPMPPEGKRTTDNLIGWMNRKVKDMKAFFTQVKSYLEIEEQVPNPVVPTQGGVFH
ncbi:MAG: hypothetical protein ACFFCS_18920 [Candidatus Hodarchaeota archaeon]